MAILWWRWLVDCGAHRVFQWSQQMDGKDFSEDKQKLDLSFLKPLVGGRRGALVADGESFNILIKGN